MFWKFNNDILLQSSRRWGVQHTVCSRIAVPTCPEFGLFTRDVWNDLRPYAWDQEHNTYQSTRDGTQ